MELNRAGCEEEPRRHMGYPEPPGVGASRGAAPGRHRPAPSEGLGPGQG